MGAAALYQASQRGAQALGIDRFAPPHNFGSSHGDTRISREAIGEGEMYMPFIRRSNAIWRQLESRSGRKLFLKSGGLIIGPESGTAKFHVEGDFISMSAHIAQKYDIAHELLSAAEIRRRSGATWGSAAEFPRPTAARARCRIFARYGRSSR